MLDKLNNNSIKGFPRVESRIQVEEANVKYLH